MRQSANEQARLRSFEIRERDTGALIVIVQEENLLGAMEHQSFWMRELGAQIIIREVVKR